MPIYEHREDIWVVSPFLGFLRLLTGAFDSLDAIGQLTNLVKTCCLAFGNMQGP